jgi:predicted kinase
MAKTLFIVKGNKGSKKSEFIKKLVDQDFLICEADKFFYDKNGNYNFDGSKIKESHEYCRNLVETYMKDSLINDQFYKEIVVSNAFTRERETIPYLELAKQYNYDVIISIIDNQ